MPQITRMRALVTVGILACVAVLLIACGETGTATPASTVAGTVAAPTKTAHFKVGDQVKASNWLVVVNSAKTSNGDGTFSPAAGNIWVVVDITMTNLDSASQDANSFDFALRGTDGTKYDPTISDLSDLTGSIESGGKTHGQIPFEVPQAQKTFTLEWSPALDVAAIWDISV